MRSKTGSTLLVGATALILSAALIAGGGIVGDQADDFEGGSTVGWAEGGASSNPPTTFADGGPNGTGDGYLENISSGAAGPGSRLVMFNRTQWTGNYTAAGVMQIELDAANFGTTAINLQIAVRGGPNATCYGSNVTEPILTGGVWTSTVFELNDSALIQVLGNGCTGSDTVAQVLANVTELRILSASGGAAWAGDAIIATLGVDNITASTVPVELQNFNVE